MHYTAPSTSDLQELKNQLGYTGKQMADLFGLGGDQQWRKYTGGTSPREMSPHMLFFAAARMVLPAEDLENVVAYMRAVGAEVDLDKSPDE